MVSLSTAAAKVEAEACGRPYRDRRSALFTAIPIQVVTFVIVCLRLLSRWNMSHSFEADDWIMVVCLVCLLASPTPIDPV